MHTNNDPQKSLKTEDFFVKKCESVKKWISRTTEKKKRIVYGASIHNALLFFVDS